MMVEWATEDIPLQESKYHLAENSKRYIVHTKRVFPKGEGAGAYPPNSYPSFVKIHFQGHTRLIQLLRSPSLLRIWGHMYFCNHSNRGMSAHYL